MTLSEINYFRWIFDKHKIISTLVNVRMIIIIFLLVRNKRSFNHSLDFTLGLVPSCFSQYFGKCKIF